MRGGSAGTRIGGKDDAGNGEMKRVQETYEKLRRGGRNVRRWMKKEGNEEKKERNYGRRKRKRNKKR